ncbi:MAG TPA: long-chain fatty acid transporter [Haliea salexigens]|uniref:Long-chain fatty acid transporter n=1 Tax=Haliea salexigens TaxID=287487 RepID=A0A3C1KJE7_9GAMM|nr:long-chain fatty acid transporter [Haliea sp.]HAN26827.1 long-chain fatty acid transporter [Haliea salexigens]
MISQNRHLPGALLLAALATGNAHATNGYFTHGTGVRAQAVAGVSFALPQDALAAAMNPAGTALVGDRLDAGLTWFQPDRSSSISGNVAGANGSYDGNDDAWFLLPDIGFTRAVNEQLSWGVAVYGNGGMNTGYESNPYAAFGATGTAGVDLTQAFITPSVAWKSGAHSFGAAATFAYQRFEARGLAPFDGFSSRPGSVTDRGHDSSTGWGVKLGWMGEVHENITLGAAWSSEIDMSNFDDYAGLFADGGGFDIPESYGAGIAWEASEALTVAADWQRILYSDITSVGNPLAPLLTGVPLGVANGPGFGWEDSDVYKLGAVYRVTGVLTLRAGVSHMDQPIPGSETFFNILAPGVIETHVSLGASWALSDRNEWNVAYTHGLEKTVRGTNSIPMPFGGGEADLTMHQNILAIGYTRHF